MQSKKLYPSLLLAAAMALLLLGAARADEASESIAFSDVTKPGTFRVSIAQGDVKIHGADVKEITVKSESKRSNSTRKDGLRVVSGSSTFLLTEKDNVATLDYGAKTWSGMSGDFQITVPINTAIIVTNAWGGDTKIADVTGDIDVRAMNGEVRLDNVKGGVSVETMNGEIHANVTEFHPGKALTFSSLNGEVVLKVPQSAKANVRFRTHNGTILTDFDDKALVTMTESSKRTTTKVSVPHVEVKVHTDEDDDNEKNDKWKDEVRDAVRDAAEQSAEAAREGALAAREAARAVREGLAEARESGISPIAPIPPIPPIPPISGGKIVSGTLNGGGPDIQVATMNGDITLRKSGM